METCDDENLTDESIEGGTYCTVPLLGEPRDGH